MSHALLARSPWSVDHRIEVERILRWLRWTIICWIILFWKLRWLSLLDPDEAHYAQLTHEMIRGGSWFVPLLDGSPYVDKPVLFHWLQMLSVSLFGETEFALRMPSACAAVALIAITRWVGASLFRKDVGEWGALMFATIPATFALGNIGLFDMVFATFLFGGVGVLLVSAHHRRFRLQYVGFALLALAVLTKGPVAILLVGLFVLLVSLFMREARGELLALNWKTGTAAVLVISGPWFAGMYSRFGAAFIAQYLLAGNVWYFTQPSHFSTRVVSHTFYVRTFIGAFFPWSVVTIGRGVDLLRHWRERREVTTGESLLWAWTVVVVGFFTLARFKLDHYIFPAAPACCLLAAHAWSDAIDDARRSTATRISILATGLSFMGIGVIAAIALTRIDLGLPLGAAMLPITLFGGGAVILIQTARRRLEPLRSLAVPVCTLLVVYATTVLIGFPAFERTRPIRFITRVLRTHATAAEPVGLYRLERWRASLRYYLGRRIERLENPDDIRRFLSSTGPAYIVMLREEYETLRDSGLALSLVSERPAVASTQGRGFRRQVWSQLAVVRAEAAPLARRSDSPPPVSGPR
jgi:4-amino-4-deoxy-L-arabinose transferase-like glycosyltransferase